MIPTVTTSARVSIHININTEAINEWDGGSRVRAPSTLDLAGGDRKRSSIRHRADRMQVSSAMNSPTGPVWSCNAAQYADGRILESSAIRHAGRSTVRAIPIQSSDRDSPQ